MPKYSIVNKEYLKGLVMETAGKMCKMIDAAEEERPKSITYESDSDGAYVVGIDIDRMP